MKITMPRVTKDPDRRKQDLLDAALALFLEGGAENTAVSDIVRQVGVAQGTFYYHFQSKDEVLDALAERIAVPLGQLVTGIAEDDTVPPPERVHRVVTQLLDTIDAHGDVLAGLVRPGNELFHQKVGDAMRARLLDSLQALVQAGQDDGSLDAEPVAETVELLLAAITHFTRTRAHGGRRDHLDRLRTAIQRLVARGVGIPE
jgi:AcrR family transcriptional regulator